MMWPSEVVMLISPGVAVHSPVMSLLLDFQTELTVLNFPIFYKQKKPLVLFFGDAVGNSEQFKALSDVAVGGVITNRLFAWVDV